MCTKSEISGRTEELNQPISQPSSMTIRPFIFYEMNLKLPQPTDHVGEALGPHAPHSIGEQNDKHKLSTLVYFSFI